MSAVDIVIVVIYFTGMLAVGIAHSRTSSSSVRSYFLGENKGKWWMLAASGAASNFDVAGTMFLVSLFYVTGLRGFWMLWSWSFFNGAFLMVYMAKWIRRTEVMTAVELMKARFGDGPDGRMARTAGAILMVTFLVFSIGYAFAGLHKFLPVLIPGISPDGARLLSVAVMAVTTVYVMLGGFSGVVLADVIQLTLSSTAGLAIGVLVFLRLDSQAVSILHAHFSTDWIPQRHLAMPAGYESWSNFSSLAVYLAFSGLLLNMSGAGGHYGEQRFLATRTPVDAAKAGGAWGLFLIPRWVMISGFVYLAVSGLVTSPDPEAIVPTVLVQIIPAGLRGLLIAALLAAFMSSFSSTVNAAASMVVCDLIQPAFPNLPVRRLIGASYVTTILVVACGVVIGLHAGSIKNIWVWMIAGVIGATLIPNVLRWHWWRFNGWGYAWGVFAGLGTAAVIGTAQSFGLGWPEYIYAPVIWAASLAGCVIASLATPSTASATLNDFYRKVHPFGAWGPVATAFGPPRPAAEIRTVALNVTVAAVGLVSCNLSVFFLLGHYWSAFVIAAAIAAGVGFTLARTWYPHLCKNFY